MKYLIHEAGINNKSGSNGCNNGGNNGCNYVSVNVRNGVNSNVSSRTGDIISRSAQQESTVNPVDLINQLDFSEILMLKIVRETGRPENKTETEPTGTDKDSVVVSQERPKSQLADKKLYGSRAIENVKMQMINHIKGEKCVTWLAGRLGIPEGFLKLILETLNISPEDLADPVKSGTALNKIFDYFQLSKEERDEIRQSFGSFIS